MSNLLNILRRSPKSPSRDVAKQRLQLVLVHDRAHLAPGLLELLKDEIIQVISRHLDIDGSGVEITFSQAKHERRLTADIPLLDSATPGQAKH